MMENSILQLLWNTEIGVLLCDKPERWECVWDSTSEKLKKVTKVAYVMLQMYFLIPSCIP